MNAWSIDATNRTYTFDAPDVNDDKTHTFSIEEVTRPHHPGKSPLILPKFHPIPLVSSEQSRASIEESKLVTLLVTDDHAENVSPTYE